MFSWGQKRLGRPNEQQVGGGQMDKEKTALARAGAELWLEHIGPLAEVITKARQAKTRPEAWRILTKDQNARNVALAVMWHASRHRPGGGKKPPSVVSVALSIARHYGAEDRADELLDPRSDDLHARMIQAGTQLLAMAASVGYLEPIGETRGEYDDRVPRVRLTAAATAKHGENMRQFMEQGLADEALPLDEPPTGPVFVKPNWRGKKRKLSLSHAFEEACDHIRRTGWKVNEFVYRTMMANIDDKHTRYLHRALYERSWRSDAKRKDRVAALEVASDYLGRTFYLDVQCDYRGRIYHGGALRFNGADKAMRPLLEFAEGEIVTPEGAQYLAAYVAAEWGQKGNLAELREWTERHTEMVLATGTDPEKNDEWFRELDDDKRWGALAASRAWWQYMTGQPVHLPCSWDAVTSGLQVYSLLMRDRELAGKVALLEGTQGTYYEDIAAACGTPETRKTAKAAAMPSFYGAGSHTLAIELIELDRERQEVSMWRERGERKESKAGGLSYDEIQNLTEDERRAWFNNYKARAERIMAKAEELAPSFVQVRGWLQDEVAPVFSELRKEIAWETPAGFQVIQDNYRTPDERAAINVSIPKNVEGVWRIKKDRVKLRRRLPTDELNPNKQASSFAANVVHSLDASWLVQTINQTADYGVRSFGTVHDCFAVHCNHVPGLLQANKAAMIDVFGPDVLASLRAQWEEQTGVEIPPSPAHDAELPPEWLRGRRALEPG